jgi:hypothetical protein
MKLHTNDTPAMPMHHITRGDVAILLGDDWARQQKAAGLLTLKNSNEQAPDDWIELARQSRTPKPS